MRFDFTESGHSAACPLGNANLQQQFPQPIFGVWHGTSVARYGQPREKRSVRGEPAGYELCEEPHALRLACLPLREKPDRSVHFRSMPGTLASKGSASPTKHGSVVIPSPCRTATICAVGVRGPERNPCGANLTLGRPSPERLTADDDPPDWIRRARTPRGQSIAGHVDARRTAPVPSGRED